MTDSVNIIESRNIYEFIIRAGLRLEAENRTVATAIMIMHRLQHTPLVKCVCNYTLAAGAIYLASKHEEDNKVGIRDVVNVTHRILHPDDEPMAIDSTQWDIRKGLARIEFVILRQLNFNLQFNHPFTVLALYLELLRSWMPKEFQVHPIVQSAIALCRDLYVQPDFVIDHTPESLAITCISIALQMYDVQIPKTRCWFTILQKTMTQSKLSLLEEKILNILNKKVK